MNITNIPAPRVPFIDERTGLMAREWYRFFLNLFVLTGSGNNPITLEELQLGPPNQPDLAELLIQINQNIAPQYEDQSGDFLATLDTAQLMSMMSRFENAEAAIQGAYLQPVVQTGTIANYNLDGSPTAGGIVYGTGPALAVSAAGTLGQVLTSGGAGAPTWATDGGGTVTTVSVVSANGLAGTVATATTTPAITLSTTVTGLLKGNGTAISAATSGTDYAPATSGTSILYGNGSGGFSNVTIGTGVAFAGGTLSATGSGGTVTTVGWTGGIVSVANPTTTPAFTIAGTSGGIPYFSSGTTWATSAALAAGSLVQGGGAGVAPATITTGTGVVTALGVNTGTAGAFVVNGGALGTPSSGTVTNLTGTASININGTVGATTANTGAFTTLSSTTATSTPFSVTGANASGYVASYFTNSSATGYVSIQALASNASVQSAFYLNHAPGIFSKLGNETADPIQIAPNNSVVGSFSSTGLAVTGAVSATSASTSAADSSYVRVAANKNVYFRDAGAIGGGLGGAAIQGATNGAAGWAALSFGATEYEWGVSGTQTMLLSSAGIVTMKAYGAGAATFSAAGVISSVSDETWKVKDGAPVDPDAMLNKLEPGYWYYNNEKKETFGKDRQLGFYAQNVNAAIGPEAAPEPEEGKPWGYYDRSVLAVTVMSLQKALATIESLTARIVALESK